MLVSMGIYKNVKYNLFKIHVYKQNLTTYCSHIICLTLVHLHGDFQLIMKVVSSITQCNRKNSGHRRWTSELCQHLAEHAISL